MSLDDPSSDDVPAILEALDQCGDSGRIVLPAGRIFQLASLVDLSKCRRCDLQFDGTILVSPFWDYWNEQTAVFTLSGATNAVIHSDSGTGIIDANNLGHTSEMTQSHRIPALFSISNNSYQIHIRNLRLQNVPGAAFHVSSGSNAVRVNGVDLETPATIGYIVEQSQHLYIWNNTVRATNVCISILPNSSNVQIEDSTCIITKNSANSDFAPYPIAILGLSWIRNVFVKNVRAVGSLNIFSLAAGYRAENTLPVEISNLTMTEITLSEFA